MTGPDRDRLVRRRIRRQHLFDRVFDVAAYIVGALVVALIGWLCSRR